LTVNRLSGIVASMSTSERRARELKERERALLDAAIALLDRDDWQAVTIEQIADRAEYAKGTVYRHFPSKDDLYARLAADWTAGTHAALEALDADRPFEPVLRDVVAVCWRRMSGDRVHARLLQHVQRADFLAGIAPETRAALEEADARTLALLAGLLDWGVAEGAIPPGPLEPRLFALAALLMGALRLQPLWTGASGLADPERVVADAALAILRAG
jgi:AcrR family transcriptional regulator